MQKKTIKMSPKTDNAKTTVAYSLVEPKGVSADAPALSIIGMNGGNVASLPQQNAAANQPQVAPRPRIDASIGPDPGVGSCRIRFEDVPYLTAVEGIRFDFAFGYRVFVPQNAPREEYEIRFFDSASGMPLEKYTMKRGQTLVGNRKFYIPYILQIHADNKLLFEHRYNCVGQRVYIVVPDGGLGDNLAWVPLAEKFRLQYSANVCCVTGEWMARLVKDLYPGMEFLNEAEVPKLAGAYACYFCGIFKEADKAWRPIDHQSLGMQRAVEAILGLPYEDVKCRLHRGSKRPFPEPFVCISTMATNPGKYWNFPDGWNTIIRFLKKLGYRVLDIDRDSKLTFAGKEYTIPSEAEDFTGLFPIQERLDLLEHAEFFIGLPSGLSWLAWNADIPVVMISGFTMPNCEFPTPYRVTNYLFCHGCWNDSSCFFDQNVPVWCPRHVGTPREIECTRVITPKMVQDTIMKIPAVQRRVSSMFAWNENGEK